MTAQSSIAQISLVSLLLAASAATVACGRAEASEKPAPEPQIAVTTTDVRERAVPKTLSVSGTLLPNRESEVAADVAGRVVDTAVERGSFVQKGAVLARLDARSAALSRSETAAQVAAARVQKENAKLECERAERLFQANAISRAELDRVHTSCESSTYSTSAAVARQQMAEKALNDAAIRAPFAGMIAERDVSVGEYVTVGKRIVTLVELNPLRLELTIPEMASAAVRQGSSVEFGLQAYPGEHFKAEVRYVGPVLRRATRDLVVEAVVENSDGRLRPGMFADAKLLLGEERHPTIPKSALAGAEPSLRAFVVQNGVVEERVVLTGEAFGENIPILKGLSAGERIVDHPPAGLKDGSRVR